MNQNAIRKRGRDIALRCLVLMLVFGFAHTGALPVKAAEESALVETEAVVKVRNIDGTTMIGEDSKSWLTVGSTFTPESFEASQGCLPVQIIGKGGLTFEGGTTPPGTTDNIVTGNTAKVKTVALGCVIQVNYCKMVKSLAIDGPSTVKIGTDATYTSTKTPIDADLGVAWSVENKTGSAAMSEKEGILYPITPGTVTVLATAVDGSKVVARFEVTIESAPAPTPGPTPTPDPAPMPSPAPTANPLPTTNPTAAKVNASPKTGDTAAAGVMAAIFVISGIVVLTAKKR